MEGDVDRVCVTNTEVTHHIPITWRQRVSNFCQTESYITQVSFNTTRELKIRIDNWQIQTPINFQYNMNNKILKPSLLGSWYNQNYNTSSPNTAV